MACFVASNVSASVLVNLLSNAACNPAVLAMVRLASVIVACFVASNMSASVLVYLLSNAACNPVVLAMSN